MQESFPSIVLEQLDIKKKKKRTSILTSYQTQSYFKRGPKLKCKSETIELRRKEEKSS